MKAKLREVKMKITQLEFQRVTSYLMEELVENTERDWDSKYEILCEELVNVFDIELVNES